MPRRILKWVVGESFADFLWRLVVLAATGGTYVATFIENLPPSFQITLVAIVLASVLTAINQGTRVWRTVTEKKAEERSLEDKIKDWLFQYSYPTVPDPQANAIFQLKVTQENRPPMAISRLKADAEFLILGIVGTLAPSEQQRISNLADKTMLIEDLKLNLLTLGVEYRLGAPYSQVYLQARAPFDMSLSKRDFMETFLKINRAWGLYELAVTRHEKEVALTASSSTTKRAARKTGNQR